MRNASTTGKVARLLRGKDKAERGRQDPRREDCDMRRRYGILFEEDGTHRMITAVVTGEMSDGTKVWTECNEKKELVNMDKQYTLQTRNHWSQFVRL